MKWKPLTMPKEVVNDQSSTTENMSRFVIEPLERGYGVTLGNCLRRVLLSSIQGAAVSSVFASRAACTNSRPFPASTKMSPASCLNVKSAHLPSAHRRDEDGPTQSQFRAVN